MRFNEIRPILTEINLAYGQIRKDYGQYVVGLANKIRKGDEITVDPSAKEKFGETVVIEPQEAERLTKLFFGNVSPEEHDKLNTEGERNLLIPPDPKAASNLRLKIKGSDQTIGLGQIYKSADLKGGKGFNTGDVAEGVLGAAVAAKFINRGKPVTTDDIVNVIKSFTSIEEIKSNKKGAMSTNVGNDQIIFRLVLNKTSFEALYDAATTGKFAPEMKGLFLSGVKYVNTDDDVRNAVSKAIDDPNANEVSINADGVAGQKGTKADLFLNIDGEVINLLSLKAGSVKQFGQASGSSFLKMQEFFETLFGIDVPETYNKQLQGDSRANFEVIKRIYSDIFKQIQQDISGNTNKEVVFLQRLYNGIFYHATRNDPNVSMVIMKATPNAPGFAKLTFGEELRKAMEQFDLKVTMQADPPKIQIYGVPVGEDASKLAGDKMLLQIRSNLKGETAKGYVRNIVEMGGLLKNIAAVEQKIDNKPDTAAPMTTGANST